MLHSNAAAPAAAFSAIPTKWNGVQFRSRLEARWAAFFTLLGWEWAYEPFDLNGWIPDFILNTGPSPTLVEVKPITWMPLDAPEHDPLFDEVATKVAASGWKKPVFIAGAVPRIGIALFLVGGFSHKLAFADDEMGDVPGIPDTEAYIEVCNDGKSYCLGSHSVLDRCFIHGERTCHSNWGGQGPANLDRLMKMWIEAGNQVQWRSPR